MSRILSIETSTGVCSVAVHDAGKLLACAEINEQGAHAEKIMTLIDDVLRQGKISFKQVDAIAVGEGPGSYTGLRIGVSTAKGLAYAGDLPLVGVNTLQAIATSIEIESEDSIISLLDARRMEVYAQVFDDGYQPKSELWSEVLDESSFNEFFSSRKVFFVGSGLEKVKSVISFQNAEFRDEVKFSAAHFGKLAYEKFLKNEFVDIAYFVPNYLKEFKALQSKKNPLLNL